MGTSRGRARVPTQPMLPAAQLEPSWMPKWQRCDDRYRAGSGDAAGRPVAEQCAFSSSSIGYSPGPAPTPEGKATQATPASPLLSCERTSSPFVIAYTCNTKKQKPFFQVLEAVALQDAARLEHDDSRRAISCGEAKRPKRPFCLVEIDLETRAENVEDSTRALKASLSGRPESWDLVLHKRTDDMVMARRGDESALRRMTIFQRDLALIRREEQRCGRRVLIIDPLEAVYCLMDRVQFSSALDALLASGKLDAWSAQQREKNRQEQVSDVRLTKWCAGTADHGAQMFSRACRETIMARLRNVDTSKPDGQKRSSPAQESDCAASHDALERKGSRKEKGFVTPEGLANDRTSCIETSLGTLEFRRPIPWIQACAFADLRYPLVVKRRTACGPRSSHDLALVYDPEGLEALLSDSPQLVGPRNPTQRSPFRHDEIYIQEYIPHGHAVFKVYVIGCESQASIHARSTLPIPQETDHGYRLLNTYDFGKDAISEQETGSGDNAGALWYPPPPSKDDASRLARFVIEHLQVTLFGLDIVRSAVDGALYIVDLNYFPSFKDVPDAHLQLLRYLRFRLESAI